VSRLLAILIYLVASAAADDGWRRVDLEHGILVEARDVPGSALHEVRASAHSDASVAAIMAVLWHHEVHPSFVPHVRHVEVIRDAGDERILYEQVDVPLLRDRDIVLRAHRTADPATGVADVTTTAITDEGPPPSSRFVRVQSSASHWHLVPAATGGTDVTYAIRTDAGGIVPAWIVNRAQHDAVPDLVHAILLRAESGGS
jgi:hypothetical protein